MFYPEMKFFRFPRRTIKFSNYVRLLASNSQIQNCQDNKWTNLGKT